eukprot:TRINITY_DN449_c0_g1_i1.p1 TRINITY_DN449_c0_g1~~TRINITY_DN449_c0_g1_i1.p1  ORF type:complete len:234 (-),score=56.48 TRINITY_DN449_c0_g1_i1:625-1326(-)
MPAYGPLGTIGEEEEEGEEGSGERQGEREGKPSDTIDTLQPHVPIDNSVSVSSLGSGNETDVTRGDQVATSTTAPHPGASTATPESNPNSNSTADTAAAGNNNNNDDDDDAAPPSGLAKMKNKARGVAGLSNAKAKWMRARQRVLFSLRFGGALRDALKARMRKRWSQVKVSVGVQGKLLQHSKELDEIRAETLENAKEKQIVTDEALYHRVPVCIYIYTYIHTCVYITYNLT